MEEHCSTGQSPQWAVVPMEEKQQEEEDTETLGISVNILQGALLRAALYRVLN